MKNEIKTILLITLTQNQQNEWSKLSKEILGEIFQFLIDRRISHNPIKSKRKSQPKKQSSKKRRH